MPNYNTTLQTNNSSLEEIITQLNTMPDAGGSNPVLQDKIVTPTTSVQTITADSGYDGLDTVTVHAMPTVTQATPSITVNASGLITATAIQKAGYVAAGTTSATKQLAFQSAKTITPSTVDQVAVSSGYYTGGNVTVKGDANLVASNIVSGKSIFGVIGTATTGGDTSIEDGLVRRLLTTYANSRLSIIGNFAFAACGHLTSVDFPSCVNTGNSTFYNCTSLANINFPVCKYIGSSAFVNCSKLTSVNFPACLTISDCAFLYCSELTSANFPKCTTIGSSAFVNCSKLTSMYFPSCQTINTGVFANCKSLTDVDFPACTTIGTSAFNRCTSLANMNFPACTTIGSSAFYECTCLSSISFPACTTIYNDAFYSCRINLSVASFPKVASIGSSAFRYCAALSKIYLGNSSVCTLANSNAFSGTSIWSNKGAIYVPTSLVASYKAASQWSYFSNRIYGM